MKAKAVTAKVSTLDSVLSEFKDVGQIFVRQNDYDIIAKEGFASLIPRLPYAEPLKTQYYTQYFDKLAFVLLNLEGKIKIYKKGEICGYGTINLPQETIEKCVELANDYARCTKNAQSITDPEKQKFLDIMYADKVKQIWDNTTWDFIPPLLESTQAMGRSNYESRLFEKFGLKPTGQKYEDQIVLLKKDIAKELIRNSPAQ
jgi:hypothetical protein